MHLSPRTLRFWDRYLGDPYEIVEQIYKENGFYGIIGKVNGEIFALGYLIEDEKHPKVPSLGIVIGDDYQDKGLGQKLMKRLLNLGKRIKSEAVYLSVSEDNLVAMYVYQKMGWKIIGEKKGRRGIKYEMRKDLW